MNKRGKARITDIFPILLFFIFTLSLLATVLMSADIYRKILTYTDGDYDKKTAALYLTEKFRSHDVSDGIRADEFKGHDAIILTERIKDKNFVTCIYTCDGYLRELYTEESLLKNCSDLEGTKILEMQEFKINTLSDDLFSLEFTDNKGESMNTCLSVRSGGGE